MTDVHIHRLFSATILSECPPNCAGLNWVANLSSAISIKTDLASFSGVLLLFRYHALQRIS